MRPFALTAVFALVPALMPVPACAAADPAPALAAERLQGLMRSEFLFQSGRFGEAFGYYRDLPPSAMSAGEALRGSQLAQAAGDADWLRRVIDAGVLEQAAEPDLVKLRFGQELRTGKRGAARRSWQRLLAPGREADIEAAREVLEGHWPQYQSELQAVLADYAAQPGLSTPELYELFQFAYRWRMDVLAGSLRARLPAGARETALAELVAFCVDGRTDACLQRLRRLDPDDYDEIQKRSVLAMAGPGGDDDLTQRWLLALPQDSASYYQRIVHLGKAMEAGKARALDAEIAADPGLNPFQRAALQGSLAELRKDWPAAEGFYRDSLATGVPTTAAVRLAVVLLRQNRREDAFAQLHAIQADASLSDDVRREAFQTEIQFHRALRSDARDAALQDGVYRRALAVWPEASAIRYQYAMRLFGQNHPEQALSELQAVIRQAPANAEALNAYGYTLAKELDRPKAGLKPIEQAYRLAPERAEILDSYGYVLHRLGRHQEALPALQKAWQLAPSAVTAAHLAAVYLQLGDDQQARETLQRGLQLDGNEAELLSLRERLR